MNRFFNESRIPQDLGEYRGPSRGEWDGYDQREGRAVHNFVPLNCVNTADNERANLGSGFSQLYVGSRRLLDDSGVPLAYECRDIFGGASVQVDGALTRSSAQACGILLRPGSC